MIERVVFDTSSLIGAALRIGSTPWTALNLAFERCHVFVSSQTISELENVLERPRIARFVPEVGRKEFLAWYRKNSRLVEAPELRAVDVEPWCRDPKDDKFLAMCLAAHAVVLVSSDHDLLVLHPWRGIPIVTPAQFLTEFSV